MEKFKSLGIFAAQGTSALTATRRRDCGRRSHPQTRSTSRTTGSPPGSHRCRPYAGRVLLKAVVVRPGLIGWNPISRTHTLEQMLEEIGEPVYRWKRKEVVE